jgi:hypothetical protein
MKASVLGFCCVLISIFFSGSLIGALAADTNPPPRLTVELRDGSRVVGQAAESTFKFHSSLLGDLKLNVKNVRSIDCVKTNSAKLTTANGDALSGWFGSPELRVITGFGRVELPVNSIRRAAVSLASNSAQTREGLVALWPGEGNANDSVGTNNGTLINGTYANGVVGQAFSFNGSSSYVSIPDSSLMDSFVNSITIELWMKSNQLTDNSDWKGIVTKGNSSWWLQASSRANTVYVAFAGVSPKIDMYGTRNVNDGQWHHVAAVYDGTNMFLYVDCTLDVSQPATGSIAQNNIPVCLGANAQAWTGSGVGTGYFFNGLIDEASIYNRALTASEVRADYEAGKGSNQ